MWNQESYQWVNWWSFMNRSKSMDPKTVYFSSCYRAWLTAFPLSLATLSLPDRCGKPTLSIIWTEHSMIPFLRPHQVEWALSPAPGFSLLSFVIITPLSLYPVSHSLGKISILDEPCTINLPHACSLQAADCCWRTSQNPADASLRSGNWSKNKWALNMVQ